MKYNCLLITLIFSIILAWTLNKFKNDWDKQQLVNKSNDHSLESWSEYGLPVNFTKPILLKNAFNISQLMVQNNNTKYLYNLNDSCISLIKERFIKFFGTKTVPIFAPNTRRERTLNDNNTIYIDINTYLTDNKYDRYTMHTVNKLANKTDYNNFIGYSDNENSIFMNLLKNKYVNTIYSGTQFFSARGIGTGSPLHFAWGYNMFWMFGGKKRWIIINPNYLYLFKCKMGDGGIYGACLTDNYAISGIFNDVNIDKNIIQYININNISNNDYFDYILSPGDIILIPNLWLHSVENLTPNTFAMSLRFTPNFRRTLFTRTVYKKINGIKTAPKISIFVRLFWHSTINSIKKKLINWNSYTFLDGFLSESDVLDSNDRVDKSSQQSSNTFN